MDTSEVTPEFLDYKRAGEFCGLSRQQLWREIKAGNIRAYKAGRRTLIERKSLEEHIRRDPVTR